MLIVSHSFDVASFMCRPSRRWTRYSIDFPSMRSACLLLPNRYHHASVSHMLCPPRVLTNLQKEQVGESHMCTKISPNTTLPHCSQPSFLPLAMSRLHKGSRCRVSYPTTHCQHRPFECPSSPRKIPNSKGPLSLCSRMRLTAGFFQMGAKHSQSNRHPRQQHRCALMQVRGKQIRKPSDMNR